MRVDRAQTWESFTRNQTRILAHINEADAWSASFWSASRTQEQRQIGWSDSTAISFVEDIVFEKLFYDVKYRLKIKNTAAFPIILTINTNNLPLATFEQTFPFKVSSFVARRERKREKNKTISVSMNNAQETGEVQPRATLFPAFPEGN